MSDAAGVTDAVALAFGEGDPVAVPVGEGVPVGVAVGVVVDEGVPVVDAVGVIVDSVARMNRSDMPPATGLPLGPHRYWKYSAASDPLKPTNR